MLLALKNLAFTVLVPGTVAGFIPYRLVSRSGAARLDAPHLLVAAPLALVGLAIYFWCLWDFAVAGRGVHSRAVVEYGVAVALAFHLFVRLVEEPLLRRRFGAAYEAYRRAVPRWLPRPPRGRGV